MLSFNKSSKNMFFAVNLGWDFVPTLLRYFLSRNLNTEVIPCKEKYEPRLIKVRIIPLWCGRQDLNLHGGTTRS